MLQKVRLSDGAPPLAPLVQDRRCGPRERPNAGPDQSVSSPVPFAVFGFVRRLERIRQRPSPSIDLVEALYLVDTLSAAEILAGEPAS